MTRSAGINIVCVVLSFVRRAWKHSENTLLCEDERGKKGRLAAIYMYVVRGVRKMDFVYGTDGGIWLLCGVVYYGLS